MQIRTEEDLTLTLDRDQVIAVRWKSAVPGIIRRGIREGALVAVLPGIYARSATAREPQVRMAALQLRDPDTVFTGLSAVKLLLDPLIKPPVVTATGRLNTPVPGFKLTQRVIEPEWIESAHGLRCTSLALAAVDLIPEHGGDYVDRVLRAAGHNGQRALDLMWRAFAAHPDRAGNELRRSVLEESRDLPWSAAERLAHAALRDAGIVGWRSNYAVTIGSNTYFIDIAFPAIPLAVEIDGREFHSDRAQFEEDRQRQNALVSAGWTVLRFTWDMLQESSWLESLAPWLEELPVARYPTA